MMHVHAFAGVYTTQESDVTLESAVHLSVINHWLIDRWEKSVAIITEFKHSGCLIVM